MSTVRRYSSKVAAEAAAEALRGAGIIASVVGEADALAHYGLTKGSGEFAVLIRDVDRRDEAARLLAELDSQPTDPEPGWEDAVGAPDLSRLDPALEVPCTQCGFDLRGLARSAAGTIVCPECGATVDCLRAILQRHGPEALEGCYPDPVDLTPDESVNAAPLFCRRCRYSLDGLPQVGQCPECGLDYSKRDMLRR